MAGRIITKGIAWTVALATCTVAPPGRALAAAAEIGFSARLADSGTPVTGDHSIAVGLYDVPAGGAALWTETHAAVAIDAGVAHLVLGSVSSLDDALLNGAPLFLEVTVDGTTLSPRLEVLAAPYAVHASKAATALTCSTAQTANTLGGLAPADVQARVAGTCGVGSAIRSIDAAGVVVCEADDVGAYAPGFGLTLAGSTFAANTAQVQQRVAATCPAGQAIRAIDASGGVSCEVDDDTTYSAGSGIALTGTTFATDGAVVARKDSAAGPQTFDGGTLYLDYNNDRIGVGTAAPQATLDVNGTARAESYALRTSRSGRFFIPGSSMTPANLLPQDGERWASGGGAYGYIYPDNFPPYAMRLSAAVILPNGAWITSLFCEYYDDSAINSLNVSAYLRRRSFGSTAMTAIGSVSASTTAAEASTVIRNASTPLTFLFDRDQYSYFLDARIDVIDEWDGANLRLYGCGVDYTYSSLTD